ncbi:MAG TPA: aminotransferase class V-fold PLP-dependent enzyme [Longimicrobiaceae bacterium]|nr:aminotransferase class V-fold PLP-dependent enzyme [Longimicrobiaceae bacterium]
MNEVSPAPDLTAAPFFTELRSREFRRLDEQGQVYLDFTGSGLYAESQLRRHAELLTGTVLGNPHSRNPTSRAATHVVDEARARVLRFFGTEAEEYEVIFTPNATGALKLVAESFPFTDRSRFVLTADNHNSVNGIREYAAAHGAEVRYVPLNRELRIHSPEEQLRGADAGARNLFVFPAQSNFSGVKHPLEWTGLARSLGYDVFLDAAAFVPSSPLRLSDVSPDFACVSFYKMFGFPTGVGALLARREALHRLHRPWFGGGTVRFVSAQPGVMLPWTTGRGFEDGTLDFLGIAALPAGFDFLEGIGMERVRARVMELTDRLLRALAELRHANGAPLVRVYGPQGCERRGATVALNLLDSKGELIDFFEVERRANAAGVSIRTGYFCNPGAAEFAFEHDDAKVRACAAEITPESWDLRQFSVCLRDRPVGAVRVSLGVHTSVADLERFLEVVGSFRE